MKKGAILLGISFLLSKILGLLRDNLLASQFGASGGQGIFNLDTYYAAFRLPDLLFNLLSYSVLSAAFLPIFVEVLKKENRQNAFYFANQILHAIAAAAIIFSVALFIFAPYILRIFVPGFSQNDFQTTVAVTRIMLVTPFFFTIGGIAGGIQNAFHKFLGLAIAPVLYNLGILGGIIFLSKQYGVYGIAIGVSFGALLNALALVPGIINSGFRYVLPKILWTSRVKEMLKLAIPRIFGMSVIQLSLIVDTVIASTLATGSIAIINFASNLESLPVGIIGMSIAVVSFGRLASHAALGKMEFFAKEMTDNLRRILFLIIPLALGMMLLRFEIVGLLLGHGRFNLSDIHLTANTLAFFLCGLIFGGNVFLLARGFFALKDTKTPVFVSIVSVSANIALSLILTKIYMLGTYGLAISNAASNIINVSLLFLLLQKKLKARLLEIAEIIKFIASSLVMAAAVYLTKLIASNIFAGMNNYIKFTGEITACALVGAFFYFGFCFLLKCKDRYFWKMQKQDDIIQL